MLSNREIKWINSLKNKKYRLKHRAYIAEGPRLVNDLIYNGEKALKILRTAGVEVAGQHEQDVVVEVTDAELKKVSGMVRPNGVLGIFELPEDRTPIDHPEGEWGFALDFIQDPGNLGTIMRTLSWFGVDYLYCSSDSVDAYNPKVVQASMGGIARIKVYYVDLGEFLDRQCVPVYAAEMDGLPITGTDLEPGIIVLGNEGAGISKAVRAACNTPIGIPKTGAGESLNVAVTAAIFAAWFKLHG
jgi:TrmH family RNA methyltransferase